MAPCLYYNTVRLGWLLLQAIINRWREADRRECALSDIFQAGKSFGAKEFLQSSATEIGDRKDFFDFEAGFLKNLFDIFWVVIIKTIRIKVFKMSDITTEGVNVGFFEPVAEHFGEGAFVGNFNNSNAARFQNSIKLVRDGLHIFEVVSGTDHHQSIKAVLLEGEVVNIASFGVNFVTIKLLGLGELGLRIVKKRS